MNLSRMQLEEISKESFQKRHLSLCGEEFRGINHMDPVSMRFPFIYFDYETLLIEFLENASADRVGVNSKGTWHRYAARNITSSEIREISDTARADKYKYNHFEVRFMPYGKLSEAGEYETGITVFFREEGNAIISYKVAFGRESWPAFTWKKEPTMKKGGAYGLWTPTLADRASLIIQSISDKISRK